MPRTPREDHPDAWHHVMNRGAGRSAIYRNDDDRRYFLECVAIAAERSQIEIHAFCLMSTHYHLLVRSGMGRLSAGMQYLSGRFTRYFNQATGRDGPIFRGRFTSVPIRSNAHILQALRYIHLNPVTAGVVLEPDDWPWSSASAYDGDRPSPIWLKLDFMLEQFEPGDRLARYREFMADGLDTATAEFYGRQGW